MQGQDNGGENSPGQTLRAVIDSAGKWPDIVLAV
jgi:hypothetical protein